MGARRRALVVLAIFAVASVTTSLILIRTADRVAADSGAIEVASAQATQLRMFRGELLVWAAGGFSGDEIDQVMASDRVAQVAAVRGGLLGVRGAGATYHVIPVEAMAVDPVAYASAAGRAGDVLRQALPHGVVLSQTGARLRHLGVGGRLQLTGGVVLTVSAVVDDQLLAGYEAAVDRALARRLGLTRATYLLLRPRGGVAELEAAVRALLHRRALRFLLPGQRGWFRAGDTLPLAQIKARFGEWAVRSLDDPSPSPAWLARNVVARTVPVLGQVHCHRAIIADLAAAMAELQRLHLEHLVDLAAVGEHGGCMDPRHPASAAGAAGSGKAVILSHAEWGIDVELGTTAKVDQRLVQVMARHGFTWGGRWLPPAPDRFEWVGTGA
jgi:hypothetical protein